jgi:TPR repeat protein/uncharacterized caspase-like protein
MARRVALITGVEEYQDQTIRSLSCVDSDCTRLDGFFRYAARFDDVRLLRGSSSQQILDAASEMVSKLSPGDLFLFYFSGHGIQHDRHHLLLCRNARLQRLKYLQEVVPIDLLRDETEREGVNRVLILDACRSDLLHERGSAVTGLTGEQALRDVVNSRRSVAKSESFGVLCSCSEGQQAVEIPQIGHGLFTAALLETLNAATAAGAAVRLSDAWRVELSQRMHRLAETHGLLATQRPWIQWDGDDVPVILEGAVRPAVATVESTAATTNPPSRQSVQLVSPPQLHVLTEPAGAAIVIDGKECGQSPLAIPLDAGQHHLQASLAGYQSAVHWIKFGGTTDEEINLDLKRVARLRVKTDPTGAEIEIDGENYGKSPVDLALQPGRHRIRATLAHYQTASGWVEFAGRKDDELQLTLKAAPTIAVRRTPLETENSAADEDLEVAEDVLEDGDLDEIDVFEPAAEDFEATPLKDVPTTTDPWRRSVELDYRRYLHDGESYLEREAPSKISMWHKGSEFGIAEAQLLLGLSFARGMGVKRDRDAAYDLLYKAAQQGNAMAQYNLGWLCYDGPKGVAKAAEWCKKAAAQGLLDALRTMGGFYRMGIGVEKDLNESIRTYRLAAKQGDSLSMYRLAELYANEPGMQDETEATKWYQLAAEKGDVDAQFKLGVRYEHGQGISQDRSAARNWYKRAAEQGHSLARATLNHRLGATE